MGEKMSFLYNEENQCFCMELNDILFSCEVDYPFLEFFAERLAQKYKSRLPFIAEYVVGNKEFIETYGGMSQEEFLIMLEEMTIPWIFLKENNSGTIAYCDSEYVIEFCFRGDFEMFSDFSIDE